MNAGVTIKSTQLIAESRAELIRIADWWQDYSQDFIQGGFFGEVAADNSPVINANKGVILNTRILWFFSEVALQVDSENYHQAANRAYEYLRDYFVDHKFGGVYWELTAEGKIANSKKQIYAQAFAIYALSSYYKLSGDSAALDLAIHLFELIEACGVDQKNQGYLEAFTREWKPIEDLRLSDKDLNFPKSQNTHLHILEAYTSLYKVYSQEKVQQALRYNIDMFDRYMMDRSTGHLRMFMDLQWQDHSPGFTYGHDIEAAWLIGLALDVLGDQTLQQKMLPDLIKIVEINYLTAPAADGHIKDGFNFSTQIENTESVWWVQAEALVGYLYAWRWTKEEKYFLAAEAVWDFIKQHQIDTENGEWFWLSKKDDASRQSDYKAGFWKCPYHNGRAMMEVMRLLNETLPFVKK